MPTIVMLRDGTLELFPGLARAYEAARYDRSRTLAECAPGVPRAAPRAGAGFDRPGISPAQFCRLLGARMAAAAPVRALLFPVVAPDARGLALEALSADAARAVLGRSLLKPGHPTRLSALFAPCATRAVPAPAHAPAHAPVHAPGRAPVGAGPLEVAPALEAERCARLVARVPAFAVRLGPDAYARHLGPVLASALERV
jgi:hypothetical protein